MDYQWLPACGENRPGETTTTCPGMYTCESADETKWILWGREQPDGAWHILDSDCYSKEPPDAAPELRPQVSDVDVLREVRRVGLPDAEISVQPEGATLVNFDTIFYTDRPVFTHTVTLLGYEVDIRAEPAEFRWHHGDGTEQITETPGGPYPAMDVIHQYADAHVTVRPRVDVTYRVSWRVDDADWHELDELLTATGSPTTLDVKEATAVLQDPYR